MHQPSNCVQKYSTMGKNQAESTARGVKLGAKDVKTRALNGKQGQKYGTEVKPRTKVKHRMQKPGAKLKVFGVKHGLKCSLRCKTQTKTFQV